MQLVDNVELVDDEHLILVVDVDDDDIDDAIGVVLVEVDVARDSILVQAALRDEQTFKSALASLVVGDQSVTLSHSGIVRRRRCTRRRRASARRG